ncbi:MAG: extracellular solute-binding protein [Chloroflexi bacterium]|nr:extracellular solute-binding protein [Chloroflexota bacterium]
MKAASIVVVFVAVLLGSLAYRCTPPRSQAPTPDQRAVTSKVPEKTGWEAEWEKVLAAAKREGTVSIYTVWSPRVQGELRKKFQERYGIDVEFTGVGRGLELTAKLERERIAGLYLADVLGNGAQTFLGVMKPQGMLAPIEPMLILPESRDAKLRLGEKLFLDNEQKYAIPLSAELNSFIYRNTDMVREGDIKALADLLEPKWRGKIVFDDPTGTGGGNKFITLIIKQWGPDKARDYLRQLVKQEPLITRDLRLEVEWVAKGKYPLGIGLLNAQVMDFKKMGAPIAIVRAKEGGTLVAASGTIALPGGRLPHPNAARVFINWLLTREGQALFSEVNLQPSSRIDVSTAGLEDLVASPGQTFIVEDEEIMNLNDQLRTTAKEIFAPLLQ